MINTNTLIDCPLCEGEGEVYYNTSLSGRDPQCDDSTTCPTCQGDGAVAEGTPVVTLEDLREMAMEDAAEARYEAMMEARDEGWDW